MGDSGELKGVVLWLVRLIKSAPITSREVEIENARRQLRCCPAANALKRVLSGVPPLGAVRRHSRAILF